MSRDKQIEEMAKMLSEDCGSCENCKALGATSDGVDCTDYYYARQLYNAGYRKSSEVAEEIFAEIEEKIDLELSIVRKIIHAKGGRANGKTVLLGKIQMLIDLKNFLAELKKKYIGEDTNVTTNTEDKE